jgi:hypothetical protein
MFAITAVSLTAFTSLSELPAALPKFRASWLGVKRRRFKPYVHCGFLFAYVASRFISSVFPKLMSNGIMSNFIICLEYRSKNQLLAAVYASLSVNSQ